MRFIVVLLTFLLLSSIHSWAQVCPGCPELPPSDPGAPVPLTGVEYLLIAGGVLGVNKLRKSLKSEK
jgi:hypothetical protein